MATLSEASTIFGIDPLSSRRKTALKLGASNCFDPKSCDIGLEVKQATSGSGVDVSIAANSNYQALQDSIRVVHYSGLVVTVSNYHGRGTALHSDEEWHLTRVTVRSSMPVWDNPSRDYLLWDDERLEKTTLQLMSKELKNTSNIITPILPFEKSVEAYHSTHIDPNHPIKPGISFP